jgi:hypothetical protein
MSARLQRHVQGGTARPFTGPLEGEAFGVTLPLLAVESSADHRTVPHQYRTDDGIRAGPASAQPSELAGPLHGDPIEVGSEGTAFLY